MLGRQQISLEAWSEMDDRDELREIVANASLNQHFLTLAREVSAVISQKCIVKGFFYLRQQM